MASVVNREKHIPKDIVLGVSLFPVSKRSKTVMPAEFWEWFNSRQRKLDLNDAAVARLADIAPSVISKARNEEQAIGSEALEKIADALETPRSTVYRITGHIEEKGALSPIQQLWLTVFDDLDEFDREELLGIAQARAKRGKRAKQSPAT